MPFVDWKPEFSVGIERFDDDHRHLFYLLNQLHVSMATRENYSALNLVLKELVWYTQTHFRAEEVLMKRYGYPELASHSAEHDRFTEQVAQFADHFHSGQVGIIAEVSDTLREWLAQHILHSDAAYGRFFRSKDAATLVRD